MQQYCTEILRIIFEYLVKNNWLRTTTEVLVGNCAGNYNLRGEVLKVFKRYRG